MNEEEFRTGINPSAAVTTPIPFHMLETLRDKFAMAALSGLLSKEECSDPSDMEICLVIAEDVYRIADAMMEARKT